jgi:hypothetical protein
MRLLLVSAFILALGAPSLVQACEWNKNQSVQAPAPSTSTVVEAPQTPIPDGNQG